MVQDSSMDGTADVAVIIPVILRPPAWATTIDLIRVERQTSSSDTSIVSVDSIVIDTAGTTDYSTQVVNLRDEVVSLLSAGSTAIVSAEHNVDVPGANGSKPIQLLLYSRMDNATWIRWRIGVKYED